MFASDSLTPLSKLKGLAGLLLLAGCASQQAYDLPELHDWDTRLAVLSDAEDWAFTGRIAVKSGDDGFNGKIRWRQQDQQFTATVSGPLGIGTVLLEGGPQQVTLTDKDGQQTRLQDPETELMLRYGWTIPVRSLQYWALGIPDPRSPAETRFNDDGLADSLTQAGWVVTVGRYRNNAGQPMPARITATNTQTRVRLVVDNWLFFDQL